MKRTIIAWMTGATMVVSLSASPYDTNLLVNPGAESGSMTGWAIAANGGDGWAVGFDSFVYSGDYSFATSYGWDTRYQTVDLLAAGFTEAELDAQPSIVFGEWIMTRPDQPHGGYYFLTFELLGADDDPANPIATYSFGSQSSPLFVPWQTDWFENSDEFDSYGTGVRYLYFADGGYDGGYWAGDYGPHFDDALALVMTPVPEPSVMGIGGLGAGLIGLLRLRRARG